MAEFRGGVSVYLNESDQQFAPDKVEWLGSGDSLGLSPNKVPNPNINSVRLWYAMPGVPEGGDAVQGFKVYVDGEHRNTVPATNLEAGLGATLGMAEGQTYVFQVSAFNNIGGEGILSDPITVTMLTGTQAAPAPVTGLAVSGTPTISGGTITFTASVTPGVVYNIYVDNRVDAIATISETTYTFVGLSSGTAHPVVVKAFKDGLESTAATVNLTTATDGNQGSIQLARSDDFVDTMYGQAKVTYGSGVHNYGVPANKTAIQNLYRDIGWRSWRQMIPANNGAQQVAARDFMRVVHQANGCKWQGNIGVVAWKGLYNVPSYSEQEMYAYAKEVVLDSLQYLVDDFRSDPLLGNGDLGKIIHSIGGPNETNPGNGHNYANWARNTRILQETIWNAMREGKVWNGAYTREQATNAAGKAYWRYTVTRAGTIAATPTAQANWPQYFQNVPVMAFSTRAALTAAQVTELGGNIIPQTDPDPNLRGQRQTARWVERRNPHQYCQGLAPSEALMQEASDLWAPLAPKNAPTEFTEGGYNHMGFLPNGALTPEGRELATFSPDGARKCPPWVMGVYLPILYALCFKKGWKFHVFEMMDDDDTAGSGRTYEIQAYFGHVWTPNVDPTTWDTLASYKAVQRMANLLKDRGGSPTVKPTHAVVRRPLTITNRGGAGANTEVIELNKANGETYLLLWRSDLSIFDDELRQTNPRIVHRGPGGGEVRGLPPKVGVTIRLDHSTGTRQVDRFTPNPSRWIHEGVASPSLAQSQDTRSVGHDTTVTWAGANPTPDQAYGSIAAGGSFTVQLGHDLEIVRIK